MSEKVKNTLKFLIKPLLILLFFFTALPRLLAELARRDGEKKGYEVKQFKLEVQDGIKLSASLYIPRIPPATERGYPAIIMIHSWMFSRWQCHLYAPSFASDGYVVLAYDCRGWGSSGGKVHCAGAQEELRDLSDAIDYLLEQNDVPIDSQAIGVTGISYGGGHSFLIAGRDQRVRTVVPMHGWTDLGHSLAPNGSLKLAWNFLLLLTATWATKADPRNILYRWFSILELGRGSKEEFQRDMQERSAIHEVERVQCPVFIVGSWNDDLFEPNQMLRYYEHLQTPRKIYLGKHIHGLDAGLGHRLWGKELWEYTKEWFDYWLKGEDNNILAGPRAHIYKPWLKRTEDYADWPPEGQGFGTLYLHRDNQGNGGTLKEEPPEVDTFSPTISNRYVSLATSGPSVLRPQALGLSVPGPGRELPGDHVSYRTPPLEEDLEILGIPHLSAYLQTESARCQLNALLYDVYPLGNPRLITYGTWTGSELKTDEANLVTFDLHAYCYRVERGHRLQLTLTASNPLFVQPIRDRFSLQLLHGPGHPSALQLPFLGELRLGKP
jgi:predicted acyl esterase